MLTKDFFSYKNEYGKSEPARSLEIVSCYSPSYRLVAKDPELDEGPFKVLAIKRYKVNFENRLDVYVNVIECLRDGMAQELFYNCKSNEYLIIDDVYFGELLRPDGST